MNKLLVLKFTILFFFLGIILFSCKQNKENKGNWRMLVSNENLSKKDKIPLLLEATSYYYDSTFEFLSAGRAALDEANQLAVEIGDENWEAIIQAKYIQYAKYLNIDSTYIKNAINRFIFIDDQNLTEYSKYKLQEAVVYFYIETGDALQAKKYLDQILTSVTFFKSYNIHSLWMQADYYDLIDDPIECLNYLLEARNQSIIQKNDSCLIHSFRKLSDFYYFQKKYSTSITFLSNAKKTISSMITSHDSTAYFYNLIETAIVENKAGNWDAALSKCKYVAEYAKRNDKQQLASMTEGEIRSILMNKDDIEGLAKMYTGEYAHRMEIYQKGIPVLFYRLKAYIAESQNQIDSAEFYFKEAENLLIDYNPAYRFNYYKRAAQFEKRHNNKPGVIENYQKALIAAKEAQDKFMIIEAGDSILNYIKTPNYELLATINSSKDDLLGTLNSDILRDMELSNVLKKKELEEIRNKEEHSRKSNLQVQIIILLITLAFMSMIFISNFKVPKWWFKIMSYISLITLFELLLYIIVYRLDFITNHEPLKVLGIKVAIIALITPLHHWIEHKWVDFLSKHKVLQELGNRAKKFFRKLFFSKNKVASHEEIS